MTGGWGLGWPQGYKKLRLSVLGFRLVDFFPDPPSLAQMTFTQCTSMPELKFDSGAPHGGQYV